MPRISKRAVDAATPRGDRYTVWDTAIAGFGLQVLPSGVKSYIYQYRTLEGRSRRATIGRHGRWTPDQAREKAEEWRELVNRGGDPLGARVAAREAPTVGQILDAYLESGRFAEKAESTRDIDRGRIARHLKPLLGREHVHRLTAERVRRAMADIIAGKTKATIKTKARGKARVRGGPTTARDTIGLLRAILNWAVAEGLIDSNPAATVKLGSGGRRDVILQDAEQYASLFRTLDTMEREKRLRGPVADAVRLIAMSGARRGEIAGLRWRHVDLERGVIEIPPAGHKTGRRTGRPRIIGLATAAQAIIARQPQGEPDDLVFAPARGDRPIQLSKPWRAIRVEAGLPEGIGLHGLRHSMGSHLAMAGAQAAEIMTQLGHRQLSTAGRYVHWAKNAHQALAERAAATALAGMQAASSDQDAEVVELKPRPGSKK